MEWLPHPLLTYKVIEFGLIIYCACLDGCTITIMLLPLNSSVFCIRGNLGFEKLAKILVVS